MKKIVNTATVKYITGSTVKYAHSDRCFLQVVPPEMLLQGKICCTDNIGWKISLIDAHRRKCVFSLSGTGPEKICIKTNPNVQYILRLCGSKNCALRLYNTPGCIIGTECKRVYGSK